MQAIVHTRFGAPEDVLELREIATPAPGDGELLVRVRAAGVAKGDWLTARGEPYLARPSYGLRSPRQTVAGMEAAGVVVAVGPGVHRFAVGDEVFGWCHGAFAEFVAVPESQLVRKPAEVSFEEAAAAPISGLAALQAIRDRAQVRDGRSVLVIGASGGVGSLVVQVANVFGAVTTGVASTENVEFVRSLGAATVVDYRREEITAGGQVYDVVVDIAGNRPLRELRRVLAPSGTLVIVGGTGGSATMGFGRTIRAAVVSPFVRQHLVAFLSKPNLADLETLRDLLDAGRVKVVVDATYPLSEAPRAVAQLGAGRSRGKRVVVV